MSVANVYRELVIPSRLGLHRIRVGPNLLIRDVDEDRRFWVFFANSLRGVANLGSKILCDGVLQKDVRLRRRAE